VEWNRAEGKVVGLPPDSGGKVRWQAVTPRWQAMIVSALTPYPVLSAATQPMTPIIARQLHMSAQSTNLTEGMANAGDALGLLPELEPCSRSESGQRLRRRLR
jgi:hypothetical protein